MSYPLSLPADKPVITLTHPSPALWILELHNGDDSRITPTLVDDAFKPALDRVEKEWRQARHASSKDEKAGHGALVIVGNRKQDKFFSNGLDYENVRGSAAFFPVTFNPLLARLLTFPIPTVAAINGHCFAAGMMISLACDYRVMTDGSKRRAWMSMNEVHFGAAFPESFSCLLRAKVGQGQVQRMIALEGHRFTPAEALKAGLVDSLVPAPTDESRSATEAVLGKAQELAGQVCALARGGTYGMIKRQLYADVLEGCRGDLTIPTAAEDDAVARAKL